MPNYVFETAEGEAIERVFATALEAQRAAEANGLTFLGEKRFNLDLESRPATAAEIPAPGAGGSVDVPGTGGAKVLNKTDVTNTPKTVTRTDYFSGEGGLKHRTYFSDGTHEDRNASQAEIDEIAGQFGSGPSKIKVGGVPGGGTGDGGDKDKKIEDKPPVVLPEPDIGIDTRLDLEDEDPVSAFRQGLLDRFGGRMPGGALGAALGRQFAPSYAAFNFDNTMTPGADDSVRFFQDFVKGTPDPMTRSLSLFRQLQGGGGLAGEDTLGFLTDAGSEMPEDREEAGNLREQLFQLADAAANRRYHPMARRLMPSIEGQRRQLQDALYARSMQTDPQDKINLIERLQRAFGF